jgi:FkbM family methyltransferase
MNGFAAAQRAYAQGGLAAVISRSFKRAKRILIEAWAVSHSHRVRVGGVPMKIRVRSNTADLVNWEPNWKTKIIGAMIEARGGLFLDIGANIGQTLLDYSAAKQRHGYVGFEPMLNCLDQLYRLTRDNHLSDCTIVPAALSDKNAVLKLYRHHQEATDSEATIIAGLRPDRRVIAELVPSYRFDDIRDQLGLSEDVGVIKIDVEGAEKSVIAGMTETIRTDHPWILCEVLDRDISADPEEHKERCEALRERLGDLGYVILRVQKTADQAAVSGLCPVSEFPTRAYELAHHDECDYLFIPQKHVESVKFLI